MKSDTFSAMFQPPGHPVEDDTLFASPEIRFRFEIADDEIDLSSFAKEAGREAVRFGEVTPPDPWLA